MIMLKGLTLKASQTKNPVVWSSPLECELTRAYPGRELTLLGKWAIFFSNYLLVKYCGISTERVSERVDTAV